MGGGLWFWAKEVLVGSGGLGVSRNFPGKSSPSSPSPYLSTLFSPLAPFLQFFHPKTPPPNTLVQAFVSPCYLPYPLFPPLNPSYLLNSLLDPLRTPSESLHKVPKKAINDPF